MCEQSSNHCDGRGDTYAALIKRGDAVQTPDGELWVVEEAGADALDVVSAHRESDGRIHVDVYIDVVRTSVPREMAVKVADARQVRQQ